MNETVLSWISPVTDPAQYRFALDSLPQLVWVAGPDGTLEYLNRRCGEYSGLPIDDLLGWDWSWVVHPADLPETLRSWTAAIRTGTPHQVEQRLRRHDGEYRWFLVRGEPIRDGDGSIVRWYGTCTDIDETKQFAAQQRMIRMLFRAMVERNEDGLALVAPDGTVRYANVAAGALLGFQSEDLTGTDLWCSVHPDERNQLCAWLDRVMENPGQRLTTTVRFQRRDGESQLEILATNLLPDPDVRALSIQLRPCPVRSGV